MTSFAIALVLGLLVLWVVQLAPAVRYAATFRNSRPAQIANECLPKMCVHFPLRGADPHLALAMRSLLNQDYPDFELRIIIDSREDPAWEMVPEILRQYQQERDSASEGGGTRCSAVHVTTLREKRRTCSLIGSCLVQFVEELDDSCTLMAFADADMVVPPHWLREMASALVDPKVGTTLGNRWYAPSTADWGTLVR
ncbi:MAG TPA: glycosyltransferase family 2 protein, partial [Planctomycetaceae bacterium]